MCDVIGDSVNCYGCRCGLDMYDFPLDTIHTKRNKKKIKYIILFFYTFFATHENAWKVPKIRLFTTFLLSFLHFTKYFLYFPKSKTMNRMGGSLHQKVRFFADIPCTLLSTYTYPKIFNTSKTLPKYHQNIPKNPTKTPTTPPQHTYNPSIIPTLPLQRILMPLFTLISPYPITYATT